jgi:hypothetical protein
MTSGTPGGMPVGASLSGSYLMERRDDSQAYSKPGFVRHWRLAVWLLSCAAHPYCPQRSQMPPPPRAYAMIFHTMETLSGKW